MDVCDLKGRDCIERNFNKNYNCSTTCAGIYADVQFGEMLLEQKIVDRGTENTFKLQGDGGELQQQLADLIRMEVMKIKRDEEGKRQEVDREKYKMLVAEYRKFKAQNVKHFRLNVQANPSSFGE